MADVLALLIYWRLTWLTAVAPEHARASLAIRLLDALRAACLALPLATLVPLIGMILTGLPLPTWLTVVELTVTSACLIRLEQRFGVLRNNRPHAQLVAPLGAGRAFLLALAFAVATWLMLAHVVRHPFGGFDAWSMWNYRARIFQQGSGPWRAVLQGLRDAPNANYPLGWSLAVARFGSACGLGEATAAAALNLLYLLGCLGALVRTRTLAWAPAPSLVAACVLAGTKDFVQLAAELYVEIPIAFFLVCWLRHALDARGAPAAEPGSLLAPALCLAGAVWFKAEGTLHLVVGSVLLVCTLDRGRRTGRSLAILACVTLPFVAARVAWHLLAAMPNEYVSVGRIPDFVAHVTNAGRWLTVLGHMHGQLLAYGSGTLPVLAAAWLVMRWSGATPLSAQLRASAPAACALLAVWIVYLTILVGSPYQDVNIVLGQTSLRLVTQLYPGVLALWAASLVPVPRPGELVAAGTPPERHAAPGTRSR